MKLSPTAQKFVWHWGEMGTKWGISRSVAQIHALLYITGKPLNADDIGETLGIARSNVSMSLKELRGWRIVRTTPVPGDRRDHFVTSSDVWEMFRIILEERKRREIDPTIAVLNECMEELESSGGDKEQLARINELYQFFETMSTWYDHVNRLPRSMLLKFVRLGNNLSSIIS